jgi:hypothetical protein
MYRIDDHVQRNLGWSVFFFDSTPPPHLFLKKYMGNFGSAGILGKSLDRGGRID